MNTKRSRFGLPGAILALAVAVNAPLLSAAQLSTTTTLTLAGNAPVLAQTFTLQVQVSPVGPIPPQVMANPSGTVTILAGGVALATAFLDANGSAQIAVQLSSPGNYVLQAVYGGDVNYTGSTSAGLQVNVVLGRSAVSLIETAPLRPVAGQVVTLAVQVAGLPPLFKLTPRGNVTFTDNGAVLLGTAALDGFGIAQITATFLPGTHYIVATYGGDANFTGSASPVLMLVVQNSFTLTTLGANPSNAALGQVVTFTASVTATGSGGVGLPTGSVTFMDGSSTLGTAGLNGASATFVTSTLGAGTHVATAVYSGDANFASSTSGPAVVSVQPASTVSLGLTEGANGLRLTSVVTGIGSAVPTGAVQFNDVTAGKALTSATLTNGSANALLSLAPAGHTLQAVYSGDGNNAPGTSTPLVLAVLAGGFASNFLDFAPDEFASIYGVSPLAAPTVGFVDASGNTHPATVLSMVPGQINIVTPSDLPTGSAATLVINGPAGASPSTIKVSITVANVAPSLAPAGQVIRVHSNGLEESPVVTATYDAPSQSWIPVPIPFGASSTDTLYLVLYGTGFRHALGSTACSANGQALTVQYSGAQGSFPGLDQINVLLPASLQAAGLVPLSCSVDGQTSNQMALLFQ